MANPRKFSEKIALHNQKQAEETAAFEAILRDVSAATRGSVHKPNQHLHIQQNIMHQYRGGSLPNVNQMATASNTQQGFQHLEGMRGSPLAHTDRMHPRDRGRQIGPLRSRPLPLTRADCSPYGTGNTGAYLSPPPDTSWRRTNSDSAIHSSLQSGVGGGSAGDAHSPNTPPMHRRIVEVAGENSGMSGDMMKGAYPWDPKKLQPRPKSCEVPNINIYPSDQQDSQMHIPISNNTGSLPDLTILQFPSPLTTPLDVEEAAAANYGQGAGGQSPSNLSPTSAHRLTNMGPPPHPNGSPQQSPGTQRRRMNPSGPSPLVLPGSGGQGAQVRLPHSPPVSSIDPSRLQLDPRIRQQYMLSLQQQQQRHGGGAGPHAGHHMGHHHQQQHMSHHQQHGGHNTPPSQSPSQNHAGARPHLHGAGLNNGSPQQGPGGGGTTGPPSHLGPVPKVCVTSHENDPPEPSLTQYRSNMSDSGCQSPTSPHSQPSYSPSQSPGLPPPAGNTWNNTTVFEMDQYHIQQQQQQQQQQTNALQQQFEHFNMTHDNQQQQHQLNNISIESSKASSAIANNAGTPPSSSLRYSQAAMHGLTGSQEFHQQGHQQQQNFYTDTSQAGGQQQNNNSAGLMSLANSKISVPDIILTGSEEESQSHKVAKDLGNTITGMGDGSFDADFFGSVSDEALKDGLVPLDLEGLQMLTDPNMVADTDTENSFRLDQL